jgi:hypothetical protein
MPFIRDDDPPAVAFWLWLALVLAAGLMWMLS